ncbi:hypothetical protein [Rhodospirillum centenum]|uniref:Uncharacterized protein n=1 Tax=Rhodospirillum centenum (strain ATCC 51521 / SW) TaxID=414684 RepID=B6IMH4_RHOCS|nr:hypothetical protein [Rhodospirillum centenum]ACI98553.1 phage-related hypothetical protein [Rhodospirillum centenum SW]
MGTLTTELLNQATALNSLRARVDLLLAAYGEGSLDPAEIQRQIQDATQDAIDAVLAQLDGLDVSELSLRVELQRKLIGLQNAYGPEKYFFEFFNPLFAVADTLSVAGVSTVAGDDSVDISSTSKLEVGREYVIDSVGQSIVITVAEILSATRFKASSNIPATVSAGTLRRTNWVIGNGQATAAAGQVYYSKRLDLGPGDVDKAVIVRRTDNAATIRLYFKDVSHTTWTEAHWAWKRDADTGLTDLGLVADGSADTGMIDVEYRLPARGAFDLKMVVEGGNVTVKHVVGVDQETLLGGIHHGPAQPVNSSPANAATGINETPTLAVAGYSSMVGSAMAATQWQVSISASVWTAPVYDSGEVGPGLSHQVPPAVLQEGQTYHWRARQKDAKGGWSEWSAPTSFATAASFEYVITPTITSPSNGAIDIPERPTLHSAAFAVHGGSDTHAASQWQIRTNAGTYASPAWDSGADTVNKTNVQVPAGILLDGQRTYHARVRHQGAALGWSEWSPEVSFTTKDMFANIIGIALVTSGGGGGTWARVDENGNNKAADASFFNNHPVYGGITDVTVDGQAMVRVPKFYYKVGTAPTGSDRAGRKCWWVSDQPVTGFQIHPAFRDAGADIPYIYVGKYEATNDGGTKAGSVASVAPLVSIDFNVMKTRCAARNTGGVSGFRLWSIYEVAALQTLALIEMGGADSQALIGAGNTNSSAAVNTGTTNATWRGVRELWGNVWHMVDGLKTDTSNRLQVWDRNGNKTWVNTNITIAPSGWMVSALESTGTGFDFRDLFVAATVDGTQGNGTFGDYHWSAASGTEYVCYHGGDWSSGSYAGLFPLNLNSAPSYSHSSLGGRLAKT